MEKQYVLHNSECVYINLGIQHARRMNNIVMYGLPDYHIVAHISYTAGFKKKSY
jgi:hypothetical protein